MKISAGMIITNKQNILIGHVTGNNYYDIPKGLIEDNEAPIDACIRETFEETNILVSEKDLIDLGEYEYIKDKRLHLFLNTVDKFPDLKHLKCVSTFERNGMNYPEVDFYKIIDINEIDKYLTKNMVRVVKPILENINNF